MSPPGNKATVSAATPEQPSAGKYKALPANGEPLPVLCDTATRLHEILDELSKETLDPRLWTAMSHAYVLATDLPHLAPAWQPIESAPKDGTVFAAISSPLNHYDPHKPFTCWWSTGGQFSEPGWAREVCSLNSNGNYVSWPTHWTPLPSPPEAAQ